MSTELRTIPNNGAARDLAPAPDPVQSFTLLDAYAGGEVDEAPRLDALATISAGQKVTKDGKTFPSRSRDGTIVLHDAEGRAPGLLEALEATEHKRLTIAFPFDDMTLFIQQRFALYSATSLLIYGDHREIRVLGEGGGTFDAGTPEYERAAKRCKVSVSVYFTLAEWGADGPEVVMPDGLGFYRLRFTSRNSLRSIVGTLKHVAKFSRGKLAGIPFDLVLVNRDTSDSEGKRRDICVWTINMRPPETMRLTSRTFADTLTRGLAQGSMLMLPAPSTETLELAAVEGPEADLDEPSEDEAALIGRGGRCDRDYWLKRWHALVAGTELDSDEARAAFLANYTSGQTRSLGEFLLDATEGDASSLIWEALSELLRASKPDADPLRIVRLQREYLDSPREEPLERDAFLWLALQLPGLTIKADVSAALEVTNVMVWEARGFGTWEDALRRLHVWVERQTAANEPAAPGDGAQLAEDGSGPRAEAHAAEALDVLRDEMDAPGLSDEERDALEFADAVEEDQPPFEDDRDPLVADAEDTVRGLRELVSAKSADAQRAHAIKPQLTEVGDALATLGLVNGDGKRFVALVLDKTPGRRLSMAEVEVLLAWARTTRARNQAQAVLAVHGGRQPVAEL